MECVRFSESVCCFFGTQFSSCAKSTSDSALCTWNVFAIVFLSQKYLRIESVLCRFHVFSRALVPETRHSPADIVLFAIFCCTFLPLPQRKPSPLNRCCKHTGARACAEMMRRGPDPRSRPWRVTWRWARQMLCWQIMPRIWSWMRCASPCFLKKEQRERGTHTQTPYF